MTATALAGVSVAGAVGAPARYIVERAITRRRAGAFPLGTFVVNVSGSLVLGLIAGAALYHGFAGAPRAWLGTGFCGAYTTFSTFTFETVRLIEEGDTREAFGNAFGSLVVGGLAAGAGLALATL